MPEAPISYITIKTIKLEIMVNIFENRREDKL